VTMAILPFSFVCMFSPVHFALLFECKRQCGYQVRRRAWAKDALLRAHGSPLVSDRTSCPEAAANNLPSPWLDPDSCDVAYRNGAPVGLRGLGAPTPWRHGDDSGIPQVPGTPTKRRPPRTHFIAFNCPSLPARFAAVAAERTSSKIERLSLPAGLSAAAKFFEKIDRDQCGATRCATLLHPRLVAISAIGNRQSAIGNRQQHKMDARYNTGFCCASQKRCIFSAVHD
jgi:hypothetical protein